MSGVIIKTLKEGESFKYLGQDENIGYVGPLNRTRTVTTKYKKGVQKIWSSELSAHNKYIGHTHQHLVSLIGQSRKSRTQIFQLEK